jgi:hypothetical protein
VFKFGAASFTSPSIFPAASLQGTETILCHCQIFTSPQFQHPFPANVLSKMMKIFGILRETMGKPQKKHIPMIHDDPILSPSPMASVRSTNASGCTSV